MSTLHRTLLIGLGFTGRQVVDQVAALLAARFPTPAPAGVPYTAFVIIDDQEDPGSLVGPGGQVRLDDTGLETFLEESSAYNPKFRDTLPRGARLLYGTGALGDLAGTRLGWRVVFDRDVQQVSGAITSQVERLFQSAPWRGVEDKGFTIVPHATEVEVYVVAALDEALGGAILLPTLELLRTRELTVKARLELNTRAVLTALGALSDGEAGARAYASMMELNQRLLTELQTPAPEGKRFDKRRTSIYEACYLVEATDERSRLPERSADGPGNGVEAARQDRLEMLVEWLAQTIARPRPDEANRAAFERIVRVYGEEPPTPNLPYYSGLVHVTYSVPWRELDRYYAARLGLNLLGAGGLTAPTTGGSGADELWAEIGLEAAPLVSYSSKASAVADPAGGRALTPLGRSARPDHALERLGTSLLAGSVDEQQRATYLTSDVPGEMPPRSLERLLDFIVGRREVVHAARLPEYRRNVQLRLEELAPGWQNRMAAKADELGGQVEGGVPRAIQLAADLAARNRQAAAELEVRLKPAEEQRDESRVAARAAEHEARQALGNAPGWWLAGRGLRVLLLGLGLIAALLYWTGSDLWALGGAEVIGALANLVGLAALPAIQVLLVMAGLCAAAYGVEAAVGAQRLNTYGHNLPTPLWLGIWGAWPIASAAAAYYLMQHWLEAAPAVPPQWLAWAPASNYGQVFLDRVVLFLGLTAGVSVVVRAVEYAFDVAGIRERANAWIRAETAVAIADARLERAQVGKAGYERLGQFIEHLGRTWQQRLERLQQASLLLDDERKAVLHELYGRERGFRRLAIASRERADKLYLENFSRRPVDELHDFFQQHAILGWLDQRASEMWADLHAYEAGRMSKFWADNPLAAFMRREHVGDMTQVVDRALAWAVGYHPLWSYYAAGAGVAVEGDEFGSGLRMSVGVGTTDDTELQEALRNFRRITGPNLAPTVHATDDRHTLSLLLERRLVPVERLNEFLVYREHYQARIGREISLHTGPGPYLDLFSQELREAREAARREEYAATVEALDQAGEQQSGQAESGLDDLQVQLGLHPGLPSDKVSLEYERGLKLLDEAAAGLKDNMKRYAHMAQAKKEPNATSWFSLLGLPVQRVFQPGVVDAALAKRREQLAALRDKWMKTAAGPRR